jgi:hypothetical protein
VGGAYTAHGPEGDLAPAPASHDQGHSDLEKTGKDSDAGHAHSQLGDSKQALFLTDENAMAQLIGVAILEFGVILHRHVLGFLCYHACPYFISDRACILAY